MFDKIIVALDTTEPCTYLFEQALALAKATGAKMTLLSSIVPSYDHKIPYYPGITNYSNALGDSPWDTYQEGQQRRKEAGLKTIQLLSEQAKTEGVQTESVQTSGNPGVVICELAATEDADLVIVGSHGRRGIDEFLMGSVSSYVMHRAPCSVMVVHKPVPTEERLSQQTTQVVAV